MSIVARGGRLVLAPVAAYIPASRAIQQSKQAIYTVMKKVGTNIQAVGAPVGERMEIVYLSIQKVKMKWKAGIKAQGMPFEDFCCKSLPPDSRLPASFKTFDAYLKHLMKAVSVKTMDTLTKSRLETPSKLYSVIKGAVDKTKDFQSYHLVGTKLTRADIRKTEIKIAIPTGSSAAQWVHIKRGYQYAKDNGVRLIIYIITE
jgi:hypothetical protein